MEGFCSLASGSKGNCLYLGTKGQKLLIDCGISCKKTIERLSLLGVSLSEIDAILVTHDHIDHILGLKLLAIKHGIPLIANKETAIQIKEYIKETPKFKIFTTNEPFCLGDLEILPFTIPHDTMDPVAFSIRFDKMKLGICADLGQATTLIKSNLIDCDYLYVEANHEPSMVHACARPSSYKKRVLGKLGHLSNEECAHLIESVSTTKLKKVQLAHLSSECNSPKVALERVGEILDRRGITIPLSICPQEGLGSIIPFDLP